MLHPAANIQQSASPLEITISPSKPNNMRCPCSDRVPSQKFYITCVHWRITNISTYLHIYIIYILYIFENRWIWYIQYCICIYDICILCVCVLFISLLSYHNFKRPLNKTKPGEYCPQQANQRWPAGGLQPTPLQKAVKQNCEYSRSFQVWDGFLQICWLKTCCFQLFFVRFKPNKACNKLWQTTPELTCNPVPLLLTSRTRSCGATPSGFLGSGGHADGTSREQGGTK